MPYFGLKVSGVRVGLLVVFSMVVLVAPVVAELVLVMIGVVSVPVRTCKQRMRHVMQATVHARAPRAERKGQKPCPGGDDPVSSRTSVPSPWDSHLYDRIRCGQELSNERRCHCYQLSCTWLS